MAKLTEPFGHPGCLSENTYTPGNPSGRWSVSHIRDSSSFSRSSACSATRPSSSLSYSQTETGQARNALSRQPNTPPSALEKTPPRCPSTSSRFGLDALLLENDRSVLLQPSPKRRQWLTLPGLDPTAKAALRRVHVLGCELQAGVPPFCLAADLRLALGRRRPTSVVQRKVDTSRGGWERRRTYDLVGDCGGEVTNVWTRFAPARFATINHSSGDALRPVQSTTVAVMSACPLSTPCGHSHLGRLPARYTRDSFC